MGRSLSSVVIVALLLTVQICTPVSGQRWRKKRDMPAGYAFPVANPEIEGTFEDAVSKKARPVGKAAAADVISSTELSGLAASFATGAGIEGESALKAAAAQDFASAEDADPATGSKGSAATASMASNAVTGGKASETGTSPRGGAASATAGLEEEEEEEEEEATPYPAVDIEKDGNCLAEIATHCKGRAPGPASLVNCITDRVEAEMAGNNGGGLAVPDSCKEEVRAFKIRMYTDISMDKRMETACKKEIHKYCDDDFLYPEPGNILACLRSTRANQSAPMSPGCKAQVFRAQLDAAKDFKMDPSLNELCSAEAANFCKDEKPGDGAIQECLRANRMSLAWDCQAELFRQEVENADDIRLNVRLFQACLNETRKFCNNVAPGDARVKDCLEEHRLEPNFGPLCKREFDNMMQRRATDWRLDTSLHKYCKADISEICYPDADDITDVANYDAKVIQCLQDFRDELKDPKCRQQVHQLTKRAAEDFRFDRPLPDACASDRTEKCKGVPDGDGQAFLCLQQHQDSLHEPCRAALFYQEVRFAEHIDFKFPMKQACSAEIQKLCRAITPGHAAMIRCLQEKTGDPNMGEDCKTEVKRDEVRSAADYRLNYRLHRACLNDIQKTRCYDACADKTAATPCGGKVLKCLTENLAKLESAACKAEVSSSEKRQVADINLDIPLQAACAADLKKLCPDVSKDHARTLACLRSHKGELAPECQAEETRFRIMERRSAPAGGAWIWRDAATDGLLDAQFRVIRKAVEGVLLLLRQQLV